MGVPNSFTSNPRQTEFVSFGHSAKLTLDGNGRPWIAFMAKGLCLARSPQNGEWESTQVDVAQALAGSPPGLVEDTDGWFHIAYCDMSRQVEGSERGLLCYARIGKDSVSRQILDQGKPMSCGVYPSMALSSSGRMAVSYHYTAGGSDRNQEAIKVAIHEGADWRTSAITGSAPGGYGSALAFDSSGAMHIAFNQRAATGAEYRGPISYAVENQGVLEACRVDTHAAMRPSIAVDNKGAPHLAYTFLFRGTNYDQHLAHATLQDGEWIISDIGKAWSGIGTTSIAIDRNGNPLIVYSHDVTYNRHMTLNLATFINGSWETETIWEWKRGEKYEPPKNPKNPSLAIDPNGNRQVCFQISTLGAADEIHLLRV